MVNYKYVSPNRNNTIRDIQIIKYNLANIHWKIQTGKCKSNKLRATIIRKIEKRKRESKQASRKHQLGKNRRVWSVDVGNV